MVIYLTSQYFSIVNTFEVSRSYILFGINKTITIYWTNSKLLNNDQIPNILRNKQIRL